MPSQADDAELKTDFSELHFFDGSTSPGSYAAIARRGSVFLGIRFIGLADGTQLSAPGKSYLYVRLRSARDKALADELDQKSGGKNIVNLLEQQLALDEAWPGITFEKVESNRASMLLGMFIAGSLADKTHNVIARIKVGELFRKLTDYAIDRAGADNCIAKPEVVAAWLTTEASPTLHGLLATKDHMTLVAKAQKEFKEIIAGQLEVPGPHLQHLQALYLKHQQAHTAVEKG
jgi:hypothetical protein